MRQVRFPVLIYGRLPRRRRGKQHLFSVYPGLLNRNLDFGEPIVHVFLVPDAIDEAREIQLTLFRMRYIINLTKYCFVRWRRMEFLTIKLASQLWGISQRRVAKLCENGRIEGAEKVSGVWLLPAETQKPRDARIKSGKYVTVEKRKNV